MNKKLLLEVADAIEANPKHFDMRTWFGISTCGSTACIAGWAIHLETGKDLEVLRSEVIQAGGFIKPETIARKVLELNEVESNRLFTASLWLKNSETFSKSKSKETKAKIAAEYVRWFVKTDGGKNASI